MSSFSLSSVLNMILQGAEGSTASQLKEGLQLKDLDVVMVKMGFKDALKLLKTGINENTLHAANRYVEFLIFSRGAFIYDVRFIWAFLTYLPTLIRWFNT